VYSILKGYIIGTLLNRLFGTSFDVMEESSRRQTTKGIWVSAARQKQNVLIMDVEGTDGRERGENQVNNYFAISKATFNGFVGL
jgi:hypothetical protein